MFEKATKEEVYKLMFLGAKYGLPLQVISGSSASLELSIFPTVGAPILDYNDIKALHTQLFIDFNEFYLEEDSRIFSLETAWRKQAEIESFETACYPQRV